MPTSAELETQAAAMLAAIRDNIAKQPKAPAHPPFVFAEADRKADGRRSPDEDTIDNSNLQKALHESADEHLQRALRKSADEHLQRALRESAEEQARHARELDEFKNALAESLKEPLKKPPVATEDYNLQAAIMESIQATLEETRKAVEGATRDPSTQAIATEALGYVDGRISQMLKMYMEEFTRRMETRNRNEALTEKLEAANTENAKNAEKIGELEAAKTENAEKIGELTEKIGELAEKLKTANTEVTELEAQVGAANVQNDEQLEAKDAEKTKKIGELTQQLQTERDELTQQLTDAKAEKVENAERADALQMSLNALINEKTEKAELVQQLQAQKDELVKQVAAEKVESTSLVESARKAFDETNAGLEKQLAAEKVKSTSLVESTKKAFDETTAGLEKQLADEKAAKAKLVTENGRLARQLEVEKAAKVTADAELTEKLAVEKASLQKALDDLKNDLMGAQNTIVDSNARFEAEKAKAEDLAKQIASAEVECTDAEVEAKNAEVEAKNAETAAETAAKAKKAAKAAKAAGTAKTKKAAGTAKAKKDTGESTHLSQPQAQEAFDGFDASPVQRLIALLEKCHTDYDSTFEDEVLKVCGELALGRSVNTSDDLYAGCHELLQARGLKDTVFDLKVWNKVPTVWRAFVSAWRYISACIGDELYLNTQVGANVIGAGLASEDKEVRDKAHTLALFLHLVPCTDDETIEGYFRNHPNVQKSGNMQEFTELGFLIPKSAAKKTVFTEEQTAAIMKVRCEIAKKVTEDTESENEAGK